MVANMEEVNKMEKLKLNHTATIVIITLLIYTPFFESYFGSTLWGLNWRSPVIMAELRDYLRPLKLVCVFLGLVLLAKCSGKLQELAFSKLFYRIFTITSYAVGILQIILLFIGLLFSLFFSTNLNYEHKEESFGNYSIYVNTVDPGAMGKAYHYFYIKCSKPFGRYELKYVKKLDWMREFDFKVNNSELIISLKNPETDDTFTVDLTSFNQCL